MESFRYVILGGGMVAGYAAKAFAEHGLEAGELAIVSSDDAPPYERPPLSKSYLAGRETDENILINGTGFYREHGIELRLSTVIEQVDLSDRRLRTPTGEEYGFEKLLIATGARVRRLEAPGGTLEGILYLRSLDDCRRIRAASEGAREAVVIGGGFIGMEVASVLAQKRVSTTMVLAENRIWKKLFTPEMSAFFRRYYEARDVRLIAGTKIASFSGDGRVKHVRLDSGRELPADLVVAGIGVVPATDVLEGTGLALDNGVVVNERLETNVPDVYAAGDVANYRDVLCGKQRRVEHWDNAVKQGQYAAQALITGAREPFENVPYFFSDIFDLSWEFWGDTAEAELAVTRGESDDASFSVWWLKGGRLRAAFVMNRPDEERALAQEWIHGRQPVSPDRLADARRPLR